MERTNPQGRYLISYRRVRKDDIELLDHALHDVGIPTWRDTRDMPGGNGIEELKRMLCDPQTAGAIIYVTPEVGDSAYVLDLEAPYIFQRGKDRQFLIMPIAAGGLDYARAASLFEGKIGAQRLETWSVERVQSDPLSLEDARNISHRLLRDRLGRLDASYPLRIRVSTRTPPGFTGRDALVIDHSRFFDGRRVDFEGWEPIEYSLRAVRNAIAEHRPDTAVEFYGTVSLPYSIALGSLFSATCPIQAGWVQRRAGRPDEVWALLATGWSAFADIDVTSRQVGKCNMALLLSVNADTESTFSRLPTTSEIGTVVHVRANISEHLCAADAVSIARSAVQAVRRTRDQGERCDTLHIFAACPVGLTFLLGQLLNTFSSIQTYEFDGVRYHSSLRFRVE